MMRKNGFKGGIFQSEKLHKRKKCTIIDFSEHKITQILNFSVQILSFLSNWNTSSKVFWFKNCKKTLNLTSVYIY